MERNTKTTLSELQIGDRFHFPKDKTVWEVTGKTKSHVTINEPGFNGIFNYKYDEFKKGNTPVVFLRHTKFSEGEMCFAADLKAGDVFYLTDAIVTNYTVTYLDNMQVNAIAEDSAEIQLQPTDPVIFVCSASGRPKAEYSNKSHYGIASSGLKKL